MLSVDLDGSRPIWPAQVECVVDLVGSCRVPSDRLDDQADDQAVRRGALGHQTTATTVIFLTLSPGLQPGSRHRSEPGYHGSDDDAPRADKRNDNEGHDGHTSPALPHSALRNVGWWLSCLGPCPSCVTLRVG